MSRAVTIVRAVTRLVVAAAIIAGDPPRLLAAQRARPPSLAGLWELPGGKVEPGETDGDALVRECREELGVLVAVGGRAAPDVPTADGAGMLRSYWTTILDGTPEPRDHTQLRWLAADELEDVPWLPADGPVISAIRIGIGSSA